MAPHRNCLVLGTNDFSMPSLLSKIISSKIDIGDICKTPLQLCELHSQKFKLGWRTFHIDAVSPEMTNDKYDLIVTDAFLSRFDSTQKMIVLENIKKSLRTNGCFVTTIRIEEHKTQPTPIGFGEWLIGRINNKIPEVGGIKGISISKANELGKQFLENSSSNPLSNINEVKNLLKMAGFSLIKVQLVEFPSFENRFCYAQVSAKKN